MVKVAKVMQDSLLFITFNIKIVIKLKVQVEG